MRVQLQAHTRTMYYFIALLLLRLSLCCVQYTAHAWYATHPLNPARHRPFAGSLYNPITHHQDVLYYQTQQQYQQHNVMNTCWTQPKARQTSTRLYARSKSESHETSNEVPVDMSSQPESMQHYPRSDQPATAIHEAPNSSTQSAAKSTYISSSTISKSKASLTREQLYGDFLRHVQSSIDDSTFASFTLKGPTKKDLQTQQLKLQKQQQQQQQQQQKVQQPKQQPADEAPSQPSSSDAFLYNGILRQVSGRLVQLKREGLVCQVTFQFHSATDTVFNWKLDEVGSRLHQIPTDPSLVSEWQRQVWEGSLGEPTHLQSGRLVLLNNTVWQVHLSRKVKQPKLVREIPPDSRSSYSSTAISSQDNPARVQAYLPSRDHNRVKDRPLIQEAPLWQALGLTDSSGNIVPNRAAKYRQCQQFVQIVQRLVVTQVEKRNRSLTSDKSADVVRRVRIVDLGCGRGYLTLALHASLHALMTDGGAGEQQQSAGIDSDGDSDSNTNNDKHSDTARLTRSDSDTYGGSSQGLVIETWGVDVRPALVQELNQIARSLGSDFDQVQFVTAPIDKAPRFRDIAAMNNVHSSSQHETRSHTDLDAIDTCETDKNTLTVVIALHACDTATDDALWYGIQEQADILVVAPCCHKQVRSQLDRHAASIKSSLALSRKSDMLHPMSDMWRHNIYRERIAEMMTDSMRALLLEIAGYRSVQVFEFVGGEHTAKNVLITAVRSKQASSKDAENSGSNTNTQSGQLRQRLCTLAEYHGVKEHHLSSLMGEHLSVSDDDRPPPSWSVTGMPLL
jgi:Methyltransferase domain